MHLELLTQQVASLLEMGETRKGIDHIVNYVAGREELRPAFYDKAIQIKARYLRAKRQASMELIDEQVAHAMVEQVHMDIAHLLQDIQEKLHPSSQPIRRHKFTVGGGIAAVITILLLALLALFSSETAESPVSCCPTFKKEAAFKVLLLPSGKNQPLHQRMLAYCDTLTNVSQFPIEAHLVPAPVPYPQHEQAVSALLGDCEAHLLIWEKGNTLHYQFLNTDSTFQVPLFYPKDSTTIAFWFSDSGVATQGELLAPYVTPLQQLIHLGLAWQQTTAFRPLLNPKAANTHQDFALVQPMYLAHALLSRRDTLGAIATLHALLLTQPPYAPAYLNQSLLVWQQHDYKNAIAHINQAIALDSLSPLAHYAKGWMLWEMGQLARASHHLKLADTLSLKAGAAWSDFRSQTVMPLQR
ncbi:MAG: hypothetical protein HC912_02265, partial [Saprospiraceae bacterium]|nr:hypothetical protein [Saprospiraceae bacterium]